MWQRWSTYEKLPPVAGKLGKGDGDTVKPRAQYIQINYTPRPTTQIEIKNRVFTALLDSGAEISCINKETADWIRSQGGKINQSKFHVHLADHSTATSEGTTNIECRIGNNTYKHTFRILHNLETEALIGTDLWSKLRIAIPPPPEYVQIRKKQSTIASAGLAIKTPQQDTILREFLEEELPKFEEVFGPTPCVTHRIRPKKGVEPVKQRYRPRNPTMQEIINEEVRKLEQEGIIEPSQSAWSSPIVLVKKKDGTYRFCIDFRKVNELTEKDAYPLPQITATLDKLRGARYLSTLDLKNGYWQVPLTKDSRPITAFTVPGKGLLQFKVMPFGLHSAPATFQRLLDNIIGPELEPKVLVYLDDIVIATRTFEEHLETLRDVFRRLRHAQLKLNIDKCCFCRDSLKYLGHIIDRNGINTDPSKLTAVQNWPIPTRIKHIRQFLGMTSWYRRFIKDFSKIAAPLTRLTKKNVRWKWGEEEQSAFEKLKATLTSAPILACPDFERKFILQTDASKTGLGAVLTQNFEDGEKVIAYASRTLNDAEKNYSATELECLAVIWGIRRMRDYLEGNKFKVITDHQSLRWLQNIDSPTGRIGRWKFEIQQYDCEIKYRKGSANKVADALSRQPEISSIQTKQEGKWLKNITKNLQERPQDFPDYAIRDGKIVRHILHDLNLYETPSEEQWKLCVPPEERQEICYRYHDEPTAGHLGIAKTIARIARKYYWPGMFRDIAKYVRKCENCQAHKVDQRRPAGKLRATDIKGPWEQVTVDLIGPLPRSKQGHTWILTMQDRFTKWLEARPLRQATAGAVTKGIAEDIILRHGRPDILISDNGTQLKSAQLKSLLEKYKIKHRTAPVHTPQCNPVERTNRTLKTMISQFVTKDHRRWDEKIAELKFAYNTAVHEATGYSPAFLNHGRELNTPAEIHARMSNYINDPRILQDNVEDAKEITKINLARAFHKQEKPYNLRHRDWKPKIGEKVWKKEYTLSSKLKGINAKLAPKYIGPMEIVRILSPVIFDLRDSKNKQYKHIHVQDLKPATDSNNTAEEAENPQ